MRETNERVEEIRRKFYTTFPNPDVLTGETATAIRDLLAALAQAERERDKAEVQAGLFKYERDSARAEVERLTRDRDNWIATVKAVQDRADQAEADLARTRALEVALYRGANAFDFWLRWAEGRGAITQASRDVYEHMRAALTEPTPPAGGQP